MDGLSNIPTDALMRAASNIRKGAPTRNGMGDYPENFIDRIQPATSMPQPGGPANFPAALGPGSIPSSVEGWLGKIFGVLERILDELIRQNIAARPQIRATDVTATGQTMDWSQMGIFDRIMMRNKGANSVWFAFDINGPAVNAFTSDLSFELQVNESINMTHCRFQKVGFRCAAGQTATVHAVGFQTCAGNQAAAIS